MRAIVRGLLLGAATGVVLGVVARALMRLVAIGMSREPELDVTVSLAVVSLFVVAASGAAVGRVLDLRRVLKVLVVIGSAAPLFLIGGTFTVAEIGEVRDQNLHPVWTIELLILSTVIVAVVLATPLAGWRAGRPARER